jgi:hypothetical protein
MFQVLISAFRSRRGCLQMLAVCACALLLAPAGVAHAQFDTGTVNGSVTDPTGAVVAGATVRLNNLDQKTTVTRKTNSKGEYEFADVQVGNYTVSVSVVGFAASVTKPFDLLVAAKQRIDVPLAVGGETTSVTVNVDNAGLQTESGDQSTTVESQQIIDLPLNGREYTDLALLAPGVQVGSLQDSSVGQRRGSFEANGNRSSVNNFLLDGLDNNSYQEANQGFNNQAVAEQTDAVQEYTVITNNYPAEYGRAGGAIVSVKTKSGTHDFHGALFEYLRNTALDAYGPFQGIGQKPALVQNQFGATAGWHFPKVKDFFFFVDYEGFRQSTHTIESATIPSLQQRSGIFVAPVSATNPALIATPLQNPITGKQYPSGVIPVGDVTPFAAAVLAVLPQPTYATPDPGSSPNYISLQAGHNFRDIGDVRLDKYFGDRLQTFVRASKQSIHIFDPTVVAGPAGGEGFGHIRVLLSSGVAGATYVLTPSSVLDARFGVTYQASGKVPYNQGTPNFYAPFSIPYPVSPLLEPSGLNSQNIYDFTGLGSEDSNNEVSNPNTWNFKLNYTLAKGRHSYSFGYEFLRVDQVTEPGFPVLGIDTYTGEFSYAAPSGVARPASSVARRQVYGLADFMFGARNEYELGNYTIDTEYFDYDYAYAEDSWKVFPRLTLTYGLRYEFSTPERANGQPIVNFDPLTNALEIGSSGSLYNQSLVNPKLDDFAPRFGFAYSLYPNIVLRGGYGLSYIQFNRYGSESDLLSNPPTTIEGLVQQAPPYAPTNPEAECAAGSQSLSCFRPTMQGYPSSLISSSNFDTRTTATYYIPRSSAPGYVQSYNIGTQVQLTPATIFNLAFVGSHDVHLRVLADYNEAPIQLPGQSVPLNYTPASPVTRRPLQNFTDIHESASDGYLRYNSLQAQMTHRAANGLFLLNSFTWSHAFDNASASLEESHGDSEFISLVKYNYDNGTSGYDQRLNDSFAAVWKIPAAPLSFRALRQASTGWTLTSITRLTTGVPINIYFDPDTLHTTSDIGTYRPDFTGLRSTLVNPRSQWVKTGQTFTQNGVQAVCAGYCNVFNLAQLSNPVTDGMNNTSPYGNLPRNAVTGPGYVNVDLGVQKNFTLPEHLNLQLRAEAYNLANHTNFKAPNTEYTGASFGEFNPGSGSVFPSRQIQVAARLTY